MQIYEGPGVDADRILLLRLRPSLAGYDAERARAFQRTVIERLERMPGVNAAAPAEGLPLLGHGPVAAVTSPRSSQDGFGTTERARITHVGDGYFEVLGLPMLAGRDFDATDGPAAPAVAIVDERLATRLGGVDRVVGQLLDLDGRPHRVVGVARAAGYHDVTALPDPYVYVNYWQQDGEGFAADSRTHVRVSGDARSMLREVRREIAAIDPAVPISEDYPLQDRVTFTFQPVRVAMALLVAAGSFALLLSAIGLYGVIALVVSTRRREIAIRQALGAGGADVRRLIGGEAARLVVPGAIVGIGAAFGAARLLGSFLYGVDPHDAIVFTAVPLVLIAVALAATYGPMRRAAAVHPAATLRAE
jgi:hypothetical protein